MDKIGLVTITYNSADVLQPFLDCVWQQTHNNLVLYKEINNLTTLPFGRFDTDESVTEVTKVLLGGKHLVPKILPENIGEYRWADTDQGGAVANPKSKSVVL